MTLQQHPVALTGYVEPNWATLPQAAAYWAVSERTLRRMIAAGQLDAQRIGKRLIRVNLNAKPGTDRPLPEYRELSA